MTERVEVVVAGGGIIGLAVAYELARRGLQVLVLEASEGSVDAAARVAAGMLAPVSEVDVAHPELTRLSLTSASMYEAWAGDLEAASGVDVGYDTTGTLIVALHRDHLAQLEHLRAFQRDRGVGGDLLTRNELRDAEPALAPAVAGGLRVPGDRQVDPRRVLVALRAALSKPGAEVRDRARVTVVQPSGDTLRVSYSHDSISKEVEAGQVVIASGAWSGDMCPGVSLPMRPVKGMALRVHGDVLLRHIVRTPDVYLVPRADGDLVIGATMEERGFDRARRAGDVLDLLTEAACVLPGVRELHLDDVCVGFRPALRDHLPAIGAAGPGLFVATGHLRDGVLLAPITAVRLAQLMCGEEGDDALAAFSPTRFVAAGMA